MDIDTETMGWGAICDNLMEEYLSIAVEQELKKAYGECRKFKIRNDALKEIARALRVEHKSLTAQNIELGEQLETVSEVVQRHLHGEKVYIGCSFDLDSDEQYAVIEGKYCKRHKKQRPTFCVMRATGLNQLITERDILKKKQDNNDEVHKSLKEQLSKMRAKLKTQQEQHDRRIEAMETALTVKKRELAAIKGNLQRFKHDFKARLNNDKKQIKEDAEQLIETYEQFHQNCIVLKDYAIMEQYINDLCYKRTGKKRDYNTSPPIHNNIYTMLGLKNIDKHIAQTFNITKKEFVNMFTALKAERIQIAHPDISSVSDTNSEIKGVVERLLQ